MNPLGISSGSCPELTGPDMASLAHRIGAQAVDLRAGKGHGWEAGGVAPLRDAGLQVSFVGISLVVGRPDQQLAEQLADLARLGATGLPVKVFADGTLDTDPLARLRAREQASWLRDATGAAGVLVETHHGYAGVAALVELCAATGCRILVDTLGLAKLRGDLAGADLMLAGYVGACQVKGYQADAPVTSRHLPLSAMDPTHVRQVLALVPASVPVLVESKAGVLAEDLAVLRSWLAPRDEKGSADA